MSHTSSTLGYAVAAAIQAIDYDPGLRLGHDLATLEGYTSIKQRLLLKALCHQIGGTCTYLEVGVFRGASLLSAARGNAGLYVGVENNLEGASGKLQKIIDRLTTTGHTCASRIEIVYGDIETCPLDELPNGVNVFFFDANRDIDSMYKAVARLWPVFADTFVLITDNWSYVSTRIAFRALVEFQHLTEMSAFQLMSDEDCDVAGWGNGWRVSVMTKKQLRETTSKDMVPIPEQAIPLWNVRARLAAGLNTIADYAKIYHIK